MSYSKRTPAEGIYRRVTVRMYGDEKFMRLSPLAPSGQALWLYLLTGPHTGPIPGVFVSGPAAMAETLGWDLEDFVKAFQEITDQGLAEFDPKTRLCFIPNAVRHNAPPNPNVVKSWRSPWLLLPECDLRGRIYDHVLASLAEVSEDFAMTFEEACGKAFGKPLAKPSTKASPKQLAKQEQEQDAGSSRQEERPTVSSAKPTVPCPYDAIVALYHENLPTLPRVRLMPAPRQKALRKLWGWVLSSKLPDGERRATNAAEALTWFGDYFARAARNDFVMGRTQPSAEHQRWRGDLDYLLTDKGMTQVIEKTEVAA